MTTPDDPINPQVPDVFRPELAPEERPVVRKWRARFAGALLVAVLVLGMSGVVFWQSLQAQAQLKDLNENNQKVLEAKKAEVDLFVARYTNMDRTMRGFVERSQELKNYIDTTPRYAERNKSTDEQKTAIEVGEKPDKWVGDRAAALDEMCRLLGGGTTPRPVLGIAEPQTGCGASMHAASPTNAD